jgi:hypothetical protein
MAIGCFGGYLGGNTRSDIQYATHTCAQYTHQPKVIHANAIKRIGRYLLGTRDKGIIFRPSRELTIDMYHVDADFPAYGTLHVTTKIRLVLNHNPDTYGCWQIDRSYGAQSFRQKLLRLL